MKNELVISTYEIVGSDICVASDDGQKVYDRLVIALENERTVSLSFRNVTVLTSAFLNTAIGQLYSKFNEEKIYSLLNIIDIEPEDNFLLKRVLDNAKEYFKDPEKFDQAVRDALKGDNDDER